MADTTKLTDMENANS